MNVVTKTNISTWNVYRSTLNLNTANKRKENDLVVRQLRPNENYALSKGITPLRR